MANTLYVGSDQEYTSIQAAIDAAQNGDTIVLKENVTSTGSISIVDKNITVDLGGFTLDAQVYIKNASDVEFKNGSMTYTNTNPSFGSAVITTGIYTDENGNTYSSGGAAALTLTGVNIYGGEAVDSYNYTHAVYYKSTGGLTITDCTVTGGTATRTENSTISRTENNTAHGIYASNCDGDIVIKNSTISGGYGNSEGETRINAGHPVGGGDAIYLSGKSNVTIEDSTVSGGSSKWYNANAGINVTNQFSGTLTVVDSTVTGGTAEGKNPSSSTSGIGGVGIYTNMSTSCKEITITGSTISGGDGGMSWNGSGIEYRNANIKLTITGSTVEAGNGENASATGSIGALMIANSTSTQIVLDDVKLNGEGNGNAVIKNGDKGVTFAGPVEVVGGTLENVKVSVDATGIEGTQAIISGNVGESVEVTVTGNENAAVIVEGGKTYITTETDPAAADTSVIYVNNAWADAAENQLVGVGKFLGVNAFADVNEAEAVAEAGAAKMVIAEGADVTYDKDKYYFLNTNPNEGGENNAFDNVVDAEKTYDMEINGTFRAYQILLNNAETTVSATGKAFATGEAFRVMGGTLTVQGSRAEDAGAPEEIFTGSWGGGVKAGADAQISAGYFMVDQEAVVSYDDTVIFVAAGIFSVDNADADFDNSYIYLGSIGTYQDVQLNFTNGANVTFANNTTVINDKAFGMDMVVDAGSTVTISDSEIMDLDTVRNTGSIVLTGDATLKAADLLSGSVITIEDLAAGDAREVTVTLIPEGQNTGKNITLSVAKDATSATAYITDFADGKYTCMLVDGGIGELRGEIELKNGSISMDATSTIVADSYAGNKAITVTIDVENFNSANKIIDLAAASADLTINYVDKEGNALTADDLKAAGITEYKLADGDVVLANVDLSKLYVSSEYAGKEFGADLGDGKFFGLNAFADFDSAVAILPDNNSTIYLFSDAEMTAASSHKLNVVSGDGKDYELKIVYGVQITVDAEFAKEITLDAQLLRTWCNKHNVIVNGDLKGGLYNYDGTLTINNGKITDCWDNSNLIGTTNINGDGTWTMENAQADNLKFIAVGRDNYGQGILNLNDTVVKAIQFTVDSNSADAKSQINVKNSTLATVLNDGGFGHLVITQYGEVNITDSNLIVVGTLTNNGALNIDGDSSVNVKTLNGVANVKGGTLTDSFVGGVVAVTGDTTFEGTNEFSKIWVSGGTLTVDGDLVTKAPYPAFFVIGNDEKVNATEKGFYNGFTGTEAGTLIVNGSYTAEEGVVSNGGKLIVNGEMTANCLYFRGGETIVAEGGILSGCVWGGVDAGASLVVDGGTFSTKKADGMGSFSNAGTFTVKGSSTLDVVLFMGDINASGVMKDSKLTFDTFDWETGNILVDGELTVENGTFAKAQFRADEGEKITLNGDIIAAASTQFKAVNGEIVVNGNFTSEVGEASSIELEGADSTLTIDKDAYLKITGGFYLNGGTSIINGNLTAETDKTALKREDADVDVAYSTWGSTYAADVTLNNAYVWNAMISVNNADSQVTVDNSLLVGWMSFDINAGTLTAQNGSIVNHQAGEGWTWSTIGADGALVVKSGSTFDGSKTNLTNNGSITVDWSSSFIANTLAGDGSITIDATGFTEGVNKVIDLNGTSSLEGKVTFNGLAEGTVVHYFSDGDVILANADMTKLYFDTAWTDKTFGEKLGDGKYFGINAFASLDGKVALVEKAEVLSFEGGNTESYYTFGWDGTHDSRFYLDHTATITTTGEGYALFGFDGQYGGAGIYIGDRAGSEEFTVTIDENAKIKSDDLCVWSKANLIIEGAITMGVANEDPSVANYKGVFNLTGSVTIAEGSDFELNGAMQNNGTLTVKEDFTISQSLGAGITVLAGRTGNGATAAISGATLTFNGFARGYSDNIIGISVKGYDSGTGAYTEEEGIAGTVTLTDGAVLDFNNAKFYIGAAGTLNASASTIDVEKEIINNGSITIDAASTIIASTITNAGTITIDAANFEGGLVKLIDVNSAFDGTISLINGAENVRYITAEDGDILLTDITADTIYVNAAWTDKKIGDVIDGDKIFGFNAFATTKAAYMAARDLGGEITIDLSGAGAETLDGTVGFGKAGKDGIYTITGGSVNTTSYGISFADTDTTVKFKDATFKLAKLYVANAEGSLIVENSVIGSAYYSGNSGGWVTAGNGSMSFDNSIFGVNFSNFTADELAAMPRNATEVKAAVEAGTYKYWAFGANNSGPHMGTAGEIAVAGSTLSTSWISLIDRAEMVLDNSVLYYGAAISIGAGQVDNSYGSYNSNEIGWDAQIWWNPPLSSVDGFRDGEVATLTVKDSIVRNIGNGNGNSGAHVQVGGSYVNGNDNSVTGECAGVLNIINSEFYTTPYDADGNAVERSYDMIVVKSNGTVNVDDSTVVTAKLVNEGAFNVTGESTVKVGNVSGNGIVLDDATLTAESNIGGSAATRVYGNSTIKGTVGNVHANWTGTKENGLYAGYTTEEVALTLDGATTGLVYVGSDAEGYAAELTVKGGSEVGGIYNRVLGSTVITGSDNVIGYISAKGTVTVENAENTYIEAMVADGADIDITNSTVEFAIGTSNNIQLDEGTTMTVTGSTLAIQQMSIDAASALVLNSSTITIDDVYDDVDLITNNGTITVDALSSITADTIENNGTITIDAAKFEGGIVKVIDVNTTFGGEIKLINGAENVSIFRGNDGDVLLTNATSDALYVNAAWKDSEIGDSVDGFVFGFNAFAEINDAVALAATDSKVGTITVIEGSSSVIRANGSDLDITTGNPDGLVIDMGNHGISVDENGAYTLNGSTEFDHDAAVAGEIWNYGKVLTIGENVTVNADVLFNIMGATTNIDGIVNVNGAYAMSTDSINVGGTLAIKDSLTVVPGSVGGSLNIAEGAKFTAGNVNIKYDSYNTNIEGSVTVDKFTSLGDVTVGNNGAFTFTEATVGDLNVTTAFEVKEASLTAETMSLYSNLVIDGLKAGEEREVTLSVIPVGETEGFTVKMKVAAGATSAVYDGTEIPDGDYDFTVFDGMESISVKGVSVSGGSFSVADSTIDLGTLNGSANVTGENTIKVGTFNGNADIAGTNDVTIGTLNGNADITGTAELNIGSVTGIVALTDAAVSGTVGGKVGVYGTKNTISGESNISTLHVGYVSDNYAVAEDVAVDVTGNLTVGNLVVGKYGTLNVGDAEGDRTTLKVTGTPNWINNSTVNLVNADVESENALSMTGQVVLDNSSIKVNWEGQMNAGGSDGKVTLKNGSSLEYTSYFYIGGYYENQSAELEITSNSKFIGKTVLTSDKAEITVDAASFSATKLNLKGALDLTNGAEATINNLVITGTGALSIDLGSTISFAALSNAGTITIDATGAAADMIKVLDYTGTPDLTLADYGTVSVINGDYTTIEIDNDLFIVSGAYSETDLMVNTAWTDAAFGDKVAEGRFFGINAYDSLNDVAADDTLTKLTFTGKEEISELTFAASALEIVFQRAEFTGDLTLKGAELSIDAESWINGTITANTGLHVYGGGTIGDVNGAGRFDAEYITAGSISGFSTVNTDELKAAAITLTNGSDTLNVKENLTVEGAIDFGTGIIDEMVLAENATVTAGVINTVGAMSVTIDLGGAYKGEAAITVAENGIFASGDLVLNLDLVNATLGDTNILVSGITDFKGTLVYSNVEYALDDTLKFAGKDYTITLENNALVLNAAGVSTSVKSDVDGNGYSDIVMLHEAGFSGAWLTQSNGSKVVWADLADKAENVELLGMGKANGSAALFFHNTENNYVGAWTLEGGKVTGYTDIDTFNPSAEVIGLGDFNGDGATDVLLRDNNEVGAHITGTGWTDYAGLGDNWEITAVGDFNADGKDDIVLVDKQGNHSGMWLMRTEANDEGNLFDWSALDTLSDGLEIVGAGDVNGDGCDDVLISKGEWLGAWIIEDGVLTGFQSISDKYAGTIEGVGDFNGDGIDDIQIRVGEDAIGYLVISAEGNAKWQQLGQDGLGEEWTTKFSAIC